jgi:hypothetical protein
VYVESSKDFNSLRFVPAPAILQRFHKGYFFFPFFFFEVSFDHGGERRVCVCESLWWWLFAAMDLLDGNVDWCYC